MRPPLTELGVLRPPATILFGVGAATRVGALVARQGRRAVICTDPTLAESVHLRTIVRSIERAGAAVAIVPGAEPELPLAAVEAAVDAARLHEPECIIGFGGGSCLDLAKLVSVGLSYGLPLDRWYGENAIPGEVLPVVALPTTAGTGSEVTPVAVLTDPNKLLKVGIASVHLVPCAAICDPELTYGAPATVTAYAGIDALAHAIESYCAVQRSTWSDVGERVFVGRNVLSDQFALTAVELVVSALVNAVADRPEARASMLKASLFAGLAFSTAGTTLAHAFQYPVGARTRTPHGLGVGVLLPFSIAFNALAVPERTAAVARALGAAEASASAAVSAVSQLMEAVGFPPTLADLGVTKAELPRIAEEAIAITRLIENNPRPITQEDAMRILEAAMAGTPGALLDAEDAV